MLRSYLRHDLFGICITHNTMYLQLFTNSDSRVPRKVIKRLKVLRIINTVISSPRPISIGLRFIHVTNCTNSPKFTDNGGRARLYYIHANADGARIRTENRLRRGRAHRFSRVNKPIEKRYEILR